MTDNKKSGRVIWLARAYAGIRSAPRGELPLLSEMSGALDWSHHAGFPTDDAGRCCVAMLVCLKVESRYRWPIGGKDSVTPEMTISVERIARSQDMRGVVVAQFEIAYAGLRATANIIRNGHPPICGVSVELRDGDGVWEIAIRLLRELYKAFE
ncbi:hypothetical protein BLA23254_06392 [Burkholderia lata]|uniref:Uncharacterized protein n=1 Tax=Burkholderia lata (strain ATCC 17760 / DSM 23089 / LMG 22485 / NCIMB 9086 / R18194 / 383) TaxID=482957 RepID=A0A6P2R665_BURL3|nr:hypothetical protein [Burkholderia lata]VWC31772.1 hypothetical protein BLA23254_06392 [Burkholderia lata]